MQGCIHKLDKMCWVRSQNVIHKTLKSVPLPIVVLRHGGDRRRLCFNTEVGLMGRRNKAYFKDLHRQAYDARFVDRASGKVKISFLAMRNAYR
jgi:hypothetical protein